MQIKWLDDLLAIAEWKNFSRAAEERCVTQSALSRRIRSLEEWVGVELVDRGTYPVQLTAAGRLFCAESRETVSGLLKLRSTLREGERMPGRSIQVTAGHSLSMTFLPKWLAQFQRHNEQFNARVVAANNINYKRPLTWPNDVVVELYVDRLGTSSVTIGHRIVSAKDDGVLYSDGNVVVVWMDTQTGHSAPLPAAIRAVSE